MRIAIAAPAPKQPRKLVWYLMAFPRAVPYFVPTPYQKPSQPVAERQG
jgi:hypothetical protein